MSKHKKLEREAKLVRKFKKLYERAQSDWCAVRGSEIHGRGVYATQDIPKETEVIEYVGEPVDKTISEDRAGISMQSMKNMVMLRSIFSPWMTSGISMAMCRGTQHG